MQDDWFKCWLMELAITTGTSLRSKTLTYARWVRLETTAARQLTSREYADREHTSLVVALRRHGSLFSRSLLHKGNASPPHCPCLRRVRTSRQGDQMVHNWSGCRVHSYSSAQDVHLLAYQCFLGPKGQLLSPLDIYLLFLSYRYPRGYRTFS